MDYEPSDEEERRMERAYEESEDTEDVFHECEGDIEIWVPPEVPVASSRWRLSAKKSGRVTREED